ncbi:MAG: hypothetical protein ACE5KH_01660 [Candidatus Geothermarchaeales archaeon]
MRSFVKRFEILTAVAVIGLFAVSLFIPGTFFKSSVQRSDDLAIAESASLMPLVRGPFDFMSEVTEAFVGTVSEPTGERVKRITQGILGHLEQDSFEEVAADIQNMTLEVRGYVELFRASFQDELWSGQIVSRVPQESYTSFVFDVKRLIEDEGRVVFAEISIEDITGKPGAEEEEESMATVRVDLDEKPRGEVVDLGPVQRFLSTAASILTQFGVFLGYIVVLIVPLSVAAFGFAIMVNRALRPLWGMTLRNFKPTPSAEK